MSSQIAIELNDSGIIVSDGQQVLQNSPGYIIDVAGHEWIGEEARNRAYLHPNECKNNFWSELAQSQNPIVDNANVKLALRHLSSVWQPVSGNIQAVILIVPANFTKTGLGLLLGICKQLSIPVRAMIHQAVLVPKQSNHTGLTVHLDMQLHHTAITHVVESNNEFSVSTTEVLDDTGFEAIYTAAAEYIAKAFISANRLDPMHSAELEQQLFDYLPTWLEQAQSVSNVNCQLNYQNNRYETTVSADGLNAIITAKLSEIFHVLQSLDQSQTLIVCVTDVLDKQFGFNQYAHQHGIMVRKLPVGFHAHQSLMHVDLLLNDDEQIYLNKQLPYIVVTDSLLQPERNSSELLEQAATHIVFRYRAYPILDAVYVYENSIEGLDLQNEQSGGSKKELFVIRKNLTRTVMTIVSGENIQVNAEHLSSEMMLVIGDCLQVGEHELMLIKVEC
ncbi:MAG: hypothetical protein AB8C40_00265 [Gammaproteobacteria bacterium]